MNVPNDPDMERAALGAMLVFPEDRARGCDTLSVTDFYLDSHRAIHRSIVCMTASNRDVDLVTLYRWMEDEGSLSAVPEGAAYLAHLTEIPKLRGSIKTYAASLRELSRRRMLLTATYGIMERSQHGSTSAALLEDLETAIAEVRAESTSALISANDAVDMVVASIQPETAVAPIASGIVGLDAKLSGGFRPGRLYFIGALPARGKTAEGRQIVAHSAVRNVPSLVFTIEATVEEWMGVDLANEASLAAWKVLEPRFLTASEREHAEGVAEGMRSWPIWFDDSSEQNIARMIAKARIAVMQHGIKLLVVDYIQRVDGGGKELRNRIGNVGKRLAEFAKKHKVAVIVLSQLHRLGDINQRPTMQNLKESGDLEAHAHGIILNYRPVDPQNEEFTGEDELIIAKNRFGRTGAVPVYFNADKLRFEDRQGAY